MVNKFTNIGKSEAYDFKIVELVENKGNSVIYTKTLNKGDSYNLILYYFDKSIRVNTFNYSYKSKFEFGYSKTEKIEFYLVNKKKYNKKDEKLFLVEYKDSNARKKEYYFCAKNIKQKELNKKITNNNCMIYVVSFLVGILNGLFASGAGQFLVFYLIYILKTETHKARALSVSVLSISSIISIIGYKNYTNVNYLYLLIIFFIAIISSYLGTKIMKN